MEIDGKASLGAKKETQRPKAASVILRALWKSGSNSVIGAVNHLRSCFNVVLDNDFIFMSSPEIPF